MYRFISFDHETFGIHKNIQFWAENCTLETCCFFTNLIALEIGFLKIIGISENVYHLQGLTSMLSSIHLGRFKLTMIFYIFCSVTICLWILSVTICLYFLFCNYLSLDTICNYLSLVLDFSYLFFAVTNIFSLRLYEVLMVRGIWLLKHNRFQTFFFFYWISF